MVLAPKTFKADSVKVHVFYIFKLGFCVFVRVVEQKSVNPASSPDQYLFTVDLESPMSVFGKIIGYCPDPELNTFPVECITSGPELKLRSVQMGRAEGMRPPQLRIFYFQGFKGFGGEKHLLRSAGKNCNRHN